MPGAGHPPMTTGAEAHEDRQEKVPPTDFAAPIKLERRRRSKKDTVSMFGLRDLWLMPFLAEVVLMFGAAWMSFCLLRVVHEPGSEFPVGSVLVLVVAYAVLAFYSRLEELFLPRKVVFVGVGLLLLISLGVCIAVLTDAYLLGGGGRMTKGALVLTPVHLFILRCLLTFRDARFTPSSDSLSLRLKSKGKGVAELRRKLRFWLS
jgi:hypothetical protein